MVKERVFADNSSLISWLKIQCALIENFQDFENLFNLYCDMPQKCVFDIIKSDITVCLWYHHVSLYISRSDITMLIDIFI